MGKNWCTTRKPSEKVGAKLNDEYRSIDVCRCAHLAPMLLQIVVSNSASKKCFCISVYFFCAMISFFIFIPYTPGFYR